MSMQDYCKKNLYMLECENNSLTSLKIGNWGLFSCSCFGNRLSSLDVTDSPFIAEAVTNSKRNSTAQGLYDYWDYQKDSLGLMGMQLKVDPSVTVIAGDYVSEPLNGTQPDPSETTPVDVVSGLHQDTDGIWRYYSNGVFTAITDIVEYGNGWFYVRDGILAADASGLVPVNNNWFLVLNGAVQNAYNGLFYDENLGWWLVQGGVIGFDYTGLFCDGILGWWLIDHGQICFDYVGLWNDPVYGWWLIDHGSLASYYTGLWNDPNVGWWLISGGTIAFDYTGLWNDPNVGWWLINGGTVAFDYTGLWNDPSLGWWLISGGAIAFDYNGYWDDPTYGTWLVTNGTI